MKITIEEDLATDTPRGGWRVFLLAGTLLRLRPEERGCTDIA